VFATNDKKTGNANVNDNIAYGDIEGVWTYVYYSYSRTESQAVAFLKYSGKELQTAN
jgi:hypothetical protein